MQWYVSQRGKSSGPFDEQRLAMLVQWGKVSSNAFICDEQLSVWIAIKRSAFAPLLPPPGKSSPGDARAGSADPALSASKQASPGAAKEGLDLKRRLGIVALSVLLAGVLMTAMWL
jgi:uncharacterized protein DUF4339